MTTYFHTVGVMHVSADTDPVVRHCRQNLPPTPQPTLALPPARRSRSLYSSKYPAVKGNIAARPARSSVEQVERGLLFQTPSAYLPTLQPRTSQRSLAARGSHFNMEALFAYLISIDRIPPALISRAAAAAAAARDCSAPSAELRGRRAESPETPERKPVPFDPGVPGVYSNLPRLVLDYVRGSASDEDLWATWRFFALEVGASVWLKGMVHQPDFNGFEASIVSFHPKLGQGSRVGVRLTGGRGAALLVLPGQKLSFCPPAPADVTAVANLLAKVLNAETAWMVCELVFCTRCERPCEADRDCEVPHPKEKRVELTGTPGRRPARQSHFLCLACGGFAVED